MSNKNFINYHVLISHSPSCLNRDDMNMQKSAIFGGVRRVRISSQSLKRAMRKSEYYEEHLGRPSDRTRELSFLYEKVTAALQNKYPKELVSKAVIFLSDKRKFDQEKVQADAVAPWFVEEIEWLCDAINSDADLTALCDQFIAITGNSDSDKKKKSSLLKKATAVIKKNPQIPIVEKNLEKAIDIALSGRMATSGLMTNIDGALAVAHVLTTHAVDADIDWFTAMDDLVTDEGDVGAGHLNTQEFSSGVFYRYASLNMNQLQENLGNVSREQALEVAKHVLHLLATIVPSAKQQSFAAHNPADFALVSFSDLPVSLANAFESPVKAKGGFLAPSIEHLKSYWQGVHRGYDLDEQVAAFQLGSAEQPEDMKGFATLSELENWIEGDAGSDS